MGMDLTYGSIRESCDRQSLLSWRNRCLIGRGQADIWAAAVSGLSRLRGDARGCIHFQRHRGGACDHGLYFKTQKIKLNFWQGDRIETEGNIGIEE